MSIINQNFLNIVSMLESPGKQILFALSVFADLCYECWIFDTGASNHITGNINLFIAFITKRNLVLLSYPMVLLYLSVKPAKYKYSLTLSSKKYSISLIFILTWYRYINWPESTIWDVYFHLIFVNCRSFVLNR